MKLSVHGERKGSANHNDRQFDYVKYAPHIDPSKVKDNIYIGKENDEMTFFEHEYNYYKENFSASVKAQNLRNDKAYHSERNRTVENLYHSKYTRPEEIIIQIGNKYDKYKDLETFEAIIRDYIKKFENIYGENCHILDAAIHVEETNIHAHVRRVWFIETEDGKKINQTQALKNLGYERPDMDQEEGKYNNAKIPFSRVERRLVSNICRQHGVNLERTEHGKSRSSLKINDYKRMQMEKDIERLTREMEEKSAQIDLYDRIHAMVESNDKTGIERTLADASRNERKVNEQSKIINQQAQKIAELESQLLDVNEIIRQLQEQLDEKDKRQKKMADIIKKYDYLNDAYQRAIEEENNKKNEETHKKRVKKTIEDEIFQ